MEDVKDEYTKNTINKQNVKLILIQTAYRFYRMRAFSCNMNQANEFLLSTSARATWETPLISIHKALENQSIDAVTSYTYLQLLNTIAKSNNSLKQRLQRENKNDPRKELLRKLQIIYYNIVFDHSFRENILGSFDFGYLDKQIISLNTLDGGARVTHGIIMYPGNSCIECKSKLSIVFRPGRSDSKGSTCMVYSKISPPKIANVYQKHCKKCCIHYNYNRIDYGKDTPHAYRKNATIFLDPDALPYYSYARKGAKTFIHQSIHKSIRNHQYCNKSTSIDIWLQHFNEDWQSDYDKLSKIKNITHLITSLELGYNTTLRYFYWYTLLCRIRDIENHPTIDINGKKIRIALMVTDEDKDKISKDLKLLQVVKEKSTPKKSSKKKSTSNRLRKKKSTPNRTAKKKSTTTTPRKKKLTSKVPATKTSPPITTAEKNKSKASTKKKAPPTEVRASCNFFAHFVNKYYEELMTSEVAALKEVPVRINESGEIEIYPGWFIVYGDGGEKISRLRCAYPAICSKLDYMLR